MKKVLSLILAIMMIATFALTVSAEEVKAGNKHNVKVTNGTYEVEADGWGCYILGESDNFEVTMTMHTSTGNPEYGINFAGSDDNGDGLLLENDDSYMSVFFQGNWAIRLIGCDNGWGNIDGYVWDSVTHATEKGNDDITITIKFANKQLSYFMDGKQIGETVTLPDSVIFGNVVSLSLKHATDTISNVTFTDHSAKADDKPVIPDEPTVAPKTGEATSIVALISILSLAGVVVVSKKRA